MVSSELIASDDQSVPALLADEHDDDHLGLSVDAE